MNSLAPTVPVSDALTNTGVRGVSNRQQQQSGADDAVEGGPETELPVPEGELLGGRYLVERIFAEGGMGVVCLGRHAQLEQPVAIKFLRRALAGKPAIVERFLNEGRALAALRSEHVVRVMDVGQLESGRPYLVMEHLDGIDLDALVDRDGPLDVETAVNYVLQVCEPLAEAHSLGIVHRDIKPENLFLWSGGPGKDIVKVLDFGLAKQFGSPRAMAVTGPQDSMGSPCYMSPEQVTTPQAIDSRTDIWSVGVVLHRLLTDTLPFEGNSILEVLSHVLSAAPLSLRAVRPELDIDPELDAIVARCLEKLPTARYSSMNELAEALTAYLEHRRNPGARPLPPPDETVEFEPDAPLVDEDDAKIRIAGVHARWPGVLVFAVLAAGAATVYGDRTGRIHVRELAHSWLTPARLGADVPLAPRPSASPIFGLTSRGVFATLPTRDADGNAVLRAEPERDAQAPVVGEDSSVIAPLSDEERARKEAAYREYLQSEGLTPLNEALPGSDAPAN
ncbi:MAG: serine/threonine-protein kinase [Myxococcales bacterium]